MVEYTFEIKISGSGTPEEIVNALKQIIEGIEENPTPEILDGAEWENSILCTTIKSI
jgi:hypothetical protein